ncbi:MAG TPA: sigma-70 family RNA polymerase sigma factor [Sedimentisphaerales bacterium]|nr:sigma-70 family RNA polymerase sigma factor [Sedimentisphaerales bacterium]
MADNDIILLRRFSQSGDAEAFSEVVRRHAGLVYGAGLRVLEDRSRAADVVQETFLELVRDAGSISGSVAGWLHRVATRKALDVVRREGRRRRREEKYAAQKTQGTEEWGQISLHVDEALDELDEELKQILIAHFLAGRTTSDIAGTRGISQATVSRRIESGVGELRKRLHRRGVIVAAAALGSLLAQNAAEAAPAAVLQELGKIALVGAEAAGTSGAAAASGTAAKAATTAVMTGVKAKIIAAAAVAAVGVGGVVTYEHITSKPVEQGQPSRQVVPSVETPRRGQPRPTTRTVRRAESLQYGETVRKVQEPAVYSEEQTPAEDALGFGSTEPPVEEVKEETQPAGYGGGSGGLGFGDRGAEPDRPEDEPDPDSNRPPDAGFYFGGP